MYLYYIIKSFTRRDKTTNDVKKFAKRIGIPLNSFQSAQLMIESLKAKDAEYSMETRFIYSNIRYFIKKINL